MRRIAPIAFLALLVASGCESTRPVTASFELGSTDMEVIRVVAESLIRPRIDQSAEAHKRRALVLSPTRIIPILEPSPVTRPLSAPYPFTDRRPPSPRTLSVELLTADERAAWKERNQTSREILDLGLAGFHVGESVLDSSASAVTLSSPAYPTPTSAILYADFKCGSTCGEGWLIRLNKGRGSWEIRQKIRLWIS